MDTKKEAKTVLDLLQNATERWANEPYIYRKTDKGWTPDTFKDVGAKSSYIAAFLHSYINLKEGAKVALIAEGRPEWVEAEYGIYKARCVSVPLSVKLSIPEIVFRINHSDADAIIFSSNTAIKVHEAMKSVEKKIKVIFLDSETDFITARTEELGYKKNTDLFYFDTVLEKGKEILEKNPALIDSLGEKITENDVCAISYTSGTSGNPKGVMLMHKSYFTNAMVIESLFKFHPREYRTLVILPTDHAFAHTVVLYHSLLDGDSIYFTDARKGNSSMLKNFPINLLEVQPKYLLLVPAILLSFKKKILASIKKQSPFVQKIFFKSLKAGEAIRGNGYDKVAFSTRIKNFFPYIIAKTLVFKKVKKTIGNPKIIVVGGAALDIELQKFFTSMGVNVLQGYGMTETGPVISACTSELPHSIKYGTVGRIAPLVECKIVKEDGNIASSYEKGDIFVRGGSLMKGYYKNEEATREALIDGWMKTGDMGYLDKDGFLCISGRSKALLISKEGEKHSPEEIESEILHSSTLLNQLILHNSENPYTVALATLDNEAVLTLKLKNGITTSEELYKAIMDDANAYLKTTSTNVMWQPSLFMITGTEWTERDGFVNSTMKLVRGKVEKAFEDRINEVYTDRDAAIEHNKAIVQSLFFPNGQ